MAPEHGSHGTKQRHQKWPLGIAPNDTPPSPEFLDRPAPPLCFPKAAPTEPKTPLNTQRSNCGSNHLPYSNLKTAPKDATAAPTTSLMGSKNFQSYLGKINRS